MHQELQLELVVEGSFRFAVKGENPLTLRQVKKEGVKRKI